MRRHLLAAALAALVLTPLAHAAPPIVTPGGVEQAALDTYTRVRDTGNSVGTKGVPWCAKEEVVDPLVEAVPDPWGGERFQPPPPPPVASPATGSITISYTGGCRSWTPTGVFDPAAGQFDCRRDPLGMAQIECVPYSPQSWYCAAWGLSAQSIGAGVVMAQVSCGGWRGFNPTGTDPKGAHTDFAWSGDTKTTWTGQVNWPVDYSIVCSAFDYWGADPAGEYVVTCNEPGAKTD